MFFLQKLWQFKFECEKAEKAKTEKIYGTGFEYIFLLFTLILKVTLPRKLVTLIQSFNNRLFTCYNEKNYIT